MIIIVDQYNHESMNECKNEIVKLKYEWLSKGN